MKKTISIILFISLILSSCATLLNSPKQEVTIITNEPCKVVVNNDSLKSADIEHDLTLNRSKKPLSIIAYNDNHHKNIIVPSKKSFAYWLNFDSYFFTGFFIRWKEAKDICLSAKDLS